MPQSNHNWSRDELILALDLYFKHRRSPPDRKSPEAQGLSRLLNRMAEHIQDKAPNYRSASSVVLKLMNFRSLDPVSVSAGKVGMKSTAKGDREVWRDFADKPAELARAAAAIREIVQAGEDGEPAFDAEEGIAEAEEGRLLTRLHMQRERSRALVEQKKRAVLKVTGRLVCEACGFDFEAAYGERGKGFIEAHHALPLHQLTPGTKTRLEDLRLLCANCHRMIHVRRPWLTVEGVQGELAGSR
jgi:5-methylcytosine-specific restriction protein A